MNKIASDEKWECYLCGKDYEFELSPGGWLGNYHPLCDSCSDSVYFDPLSKFHGVMTFHYSVDDLR